MERIAIIGSGGAGKSTLARQLGERLGLPVIHLDREHWRPGWVEPPREWWQERVRDLARGERWIIDGNYGGTLDERIAAADTVIFMDFSRFVCLWRVTKRRFQYRGKSRPDMAPGCDEQLDLGFVRWIWNYPKRRPQLLARLSGYPDKRLVTLRNARQVAGFLRELTAGS